MSSLILSSNRRITPLTDRLWRIEWSPAGAFDDRPSFVAQTRVFAPVEAALIEEDGWTIIRCGEVELRLRGAGAFTAENLEARFPVGEGRGHWQPGMEPVGALGGTTRTLDGTAGDPPVEPGLLSLDGWACVDDSGTVRLGADGWVEAGTEGGQDFYLFLHGHDFRGALRDFVELSGRPPPPPRAVMGMWWSRYWRYSADDLKALVRDFRARGFPLDVLVLDMDWHLCRDWTGYTWNRDLFPDPKAFLDWCHNEGVKVTLNLHPASGVQAFEEGYADFAAALGHPGDGSAVPFTCSDRTFMEAYFQRLHHPLEDDGVDFWWMDWQQGTLSELPGLDPLAWLNHTHHLDHDRSDRRGVMLSRWGGFGGHRYPIQFSGDTFAKWETLGSQVDFTAGSAASLAGWWSHDIGGHMQPGTPELFARWFQWGAFSPALRLHSGNRPDQERRPWGHGPEVEAACRVGVALRQRYFPLWVAAAHRFHETGVAPLTPLWLDHPTAPEAHAIHGQALLLDDLLVAPFLEPMKEGLAERLVWLPPGEWWEVTEGTRHTGGTILEVRGDLKRIPVFARAGSVLAIDPRERGALSAISPDRLFVECWPGEGGGVVVEDAGEGDGWRRGEIARTAFAQTWSAEGLVLTSTGTQGRFPGLPAKRPVTLFVRGCCEPSAVEGVNGVEWHWAEGTLRIDLPVRVIGDGFRLAALGAQALPLTPPATRSAPRTYFRARNDRRLAHSSYADAILLPPAGGARATVRWRAEQGAAREELVSTGRLNAPCVLPCPFGWDPHSGAARWSAEVEWTWGDGETQTDQGGSPWELYCGFGEWAITWATAGKLLEGTPSVTTELPTGWTPWRTQSYTALRYESLLDGPRLWCDSVLAKDLGAGGGTGQFNPDGSVKAPGQKPPSLDLVAVTEFELPAPQIVQFVIGGFGETVEALVDDAPVLIGEKARTPPIELTSGRHRLTVRLRHVDSAKAARYYRMIKAIPLDSAGRVLTGLGSQMPEVKEA